MCCMDKQDAGYLAPWPYSGLGAIPQQLPQVQRGAPFQFGGNFRLLGSCMADFEDMARWVEEAGLSYNTVSYKVAGSFINPYWTVEGYANANWQSGSDFGNAILNAIVSHNCDVDAGSVQFRVEPYYPPTQTTPTRPPMVGTPYPTPNPAVPRDPQGGCSWALMNPPDWLACKLGVTPTTALVVGGVGALILLAAIKSR